MAVLAVRNSGNYRIIWRLPDEQGRKPAAELPVSIEIRELGSDHLAFSFTRRLGRDTVTGLGTAVLPFRAKGREYVLYAPEGTGVRLARLSTAADPVRPRDVGGELPGERRELVDGFWLPTAEDPGSGVCWTKDMRTGLRKWHRMDLSAVQWGKVFLYPLDVDARPEEAEKVWNEVSD